MINFAQLFLLLYETRELSTSHEQKNFPKV